MYRELDKGVFNMATTKICNKCGDEKTLDNFYKKKGSKDGYMNQCKECKIKYSKTYRDTNKEKVQETKRKHYEKNKEEIKEKRMKYYYDNREEINERRREYGREYYQKSKKMYRLREHKRNAMLKSLPNTLTTKEWDETMEYFGYGCALSEVHENLSLEHFIPLHIGWGGTTKGNCYPMERTLNCSKNGTNPFIWIERQPTNIKENFFNVLVPYLAEQNNMKVDEFIQYVNWCFNNPRSIENIDM